MGKKRIKSKNKSKIILIMAVLLIITIVFTIVFINGLNKPFDKTIEGTSIITVSQGATTTSVAQLLEEKGIVRSANKFKLYSKINGYDGKLKTGEYTLSPSMTTEEIINIIVSGDSNTTRFTIPEGYTMEQTVETLVSEGLINKDVFMDKVKYGTFDYEFMKELPNNNNRLEGFLFPETYDVFTVTDEEEIINKMLGQFDKVFKDEYYKRAKELGYNVYDIVTIASLIERETRSDEERGKVASVIYNRLAADKPLQIDATVQYAIGEQKERLYNKDLEVDSPYNTYKHNGLPPGPICSPGESSIIAALYPDDTNYMYYVLKSKKDVTHNFAATYDEFLKYKSQYKKSL